MYKVANLELCSVSKCFDDWFGLLVCYNGSQSPGGRLEGVPNLISFTISQWVCKVWHKQPLLNELLMLCVSHVIETHGEGSVASPLLQFCVCRPFVVLPP